MRSLRNLRGEHWYRHECHEDCPHLHYGIVSQTSLGRDLFLIARNRRRKKVRARVAKTFGNLSYGLVSLCQFAVVRLCKLPCKMTPRDILLMEVMMMRLLAGLLLSVMIASSQSPQPFTAVEVSRRFDGAGNLKSEARFLLAMNRDGSLVSIDLNTTT